MLTQPDSLLAMQSSSLINTPSSWQQEDSLNCGLPDKLWCMAASPVRQLLSCGSDRGSEGEEGICGSDQSLWSEEGLLQGGFWPALYPPTASSAGVTGPSEVVYRLCKGQSQGGGRGIRALSPDRLSLFQQTEPEGQAEELAVLGTMLRVGTLSRPSWWKSQPHPLITQVAQGKLINDLCLSFSSCKIKITIYLELINNCKFITVIHGVVVRIIGTNNIKSAYLSLHLE